MWKKSCFLFNGWLMPVNKKNYLILPSLLDNHPRIGEKIIWIVNHQSAHMSEIQKHYTYWEWRTTLGNDRIDRNEQTRQPGQQDWLQPSSQISGATHRPDGLYNVVNILILRGENIENNWYIHQKYINMFITNMCRWKKVLLICASEKNLHSSEMPQVWKDSFLFKKLFSWKQVIIIW